MKKLKIYIDIILSVCNKLIRTFVKKTNERKVNRKISEIVSVIE